MSRWHCHQEYAAIQTGLEIPWCQCCCTIHYYNDYNPVQITESVIVFTSFSMIHKVNRIMWTIIFDYSVLPVKLCDTHLSHNRLAIISPHSWWIWITSSSHRCLSEAVIIYDLEIPIHSSIIGTTWCQQCAATELPLRVSDTMPRWQGNAFGSPWWSWLVSGVPSAGGCTTALGDLIKEGVFTPSCKVVSGSNYPSYVIIQVSWTVPANL